MLLEQQAAIALASPSYRSRTSSAFVKALPPNSCRCYESTRWSPRPLVAFSIFKVAVSRKSRTQWDEHWRHVPSLARSHPTIMLDTYETVLSRVVCPRRIDPFATELQLPERLPRGRWALPTPKDRPRTPEPPPYTVLKVDFYCHAPLPWPLLVAALRTAAPPQALSGSSV